MRCPRNPLQHDDGSLPSIGRDGVCWRCKYEQDAYVRGRQDERKVSAATLAEARIDERLRWEYLYEDMKTERDKAVAGPKCLQHGWIGVCPRCEDEVGEC